MNDDRRILNEIAGLVIILGGTAVLMWLAIGLSIIIGKILWW